MRRNEGVSHRTPHTCAGIAGRSRTKGRQCCGAARQPSFSVLIYVPTHLPWVSATEIVPFIISDNGS